MPAQNITGVKEVLKELKELEDGSLKALRRDIRKYLSDDISAANEAVRSDQYEMIFGVKRPGMFHNGRTSFELPTIRVGVRPRSKGGIISIDAKSPPGKAGYEILEKAGARTDGTKATGRAMIAMLRRHFPPLKAGRFVFKSLLGRKGLIEQDVKFIIEQYSDKVNARLSSGTGFEITSKAGQIL